MNPYAHHLADRALDEVLTTTPRACTSSPAPSPPSSSKLPSPSGKWSPRQILAHLADCELAFSWRLRQVLAGPQPAPPPTLQPFDQTEWATRYGAYQTPAALALFCANRDWNLALLTTARTRDDLEREGFHPERGLITFQTLLETMAGHDLNHLKQLQTLTPSPPLVIDQRGFSRRNCWDLTGGTRTPAPKVPIIKDAVHHRRLLPLLPLADPAALRAQLLSAFTPEILRGTLLLAPEGINGTLAGSPETIDHLLQILHVQTGLERAEVKFSHAPKPPFHRLKFRLKREIISFRRAQVDPTRPGTYVDPQDWNALLADPEVLLLDTRNTYEVEAGTFANAADPHLDHFSDFVAYAEQHLDPTRHPKIAMFCTGGIRCEKASAYLLQQGFPQVYHLKGGILSYLEQVSATESRYQGSCFVFDHRRTVTRADLK